jgi:hypothetical protein
MAELIDLDKIERGTLRDLLQMLAAEFDPDWLLQLGIFVLSLAAIAMIATTGSLHRWGFVAGLASQPFWIAALWRARSPGGTRMWGMFALSVVYCAIWIFGILNRFF